MPMGYPAAYIRSIKKQKAPRKAMLFWVATRPGLEPETEGLIILSSWLMSRSKDLPSSFCGNSFIACHDF